MSRRVLARTVVLVAVTAAVLMPTAGPARAAFPGANGRIVFATNRDGNFELYTINADGSDPVRLTDDPAQDSFPAFSPNGKRIVFNTDRDGDFEVYSMSAAGANPTNLSNNPAFDLEPAFSRNGKRVAFTTNRDGNFEIYAMSADGTDPIRLTNHPGLDLSPVFSPTSGEIAFVSNRDGDFEVYVMDADGTNVVQLTDNAADEFYPDWAPDGSALVYQSDEPGNSDIFLLQVDEVPSRGPAGPGSPPVNLTNTVIAELFPAFAPGGKRVVFTAGTDPNYRITSIRTDGTDVQSIDAPPGVTDATPDWQPDPQADIQVKIRRLRGSRTPNSSIVVHFNVEVRNLGPNDASKVVLDMDVSRSRLRSMVVDPFGSCEQVTDSGVRCEIPTLAAGATRTFQVRVSYGSGGALEVVAYAVARVGRPLDPDASNNDDSGVLVFD